MTDTDLVRRTLGGDPLAFTELADRHSAACLRFAARMLGSREDAEDATQETLVRAYRALRVYDERTAFQTWLFSILVNRCRSALAMRTRRSRWFQRDDVAIERAAGVDDKLDLRLELGRALDTLPPDQREAFLLKHVEDLAYEDMAAITGARVSALKMRVQRACTALQQRLQEYGDART